MSLPQSAIQTFILFLLMAAGFGAGKAAVLDERTVKKLSKFLVAFVLPCLIVMSMQKPLTAELRDRAFLVLGLSFAVYALAFPLAFLLVRTFGLKGKTAGVHAFGMVFANVIFMGFPVLQSFFGKDILFEASIATMPFQLLAFSVGTAMIARAGGGGGGGDHGGARLTIASFVTPAGIASLVGLALFLLGVTIPAIPARAMNLLGDTTTPLSMCVIGATLAETDLAGALRDWRLWATSAWRLLGFPLLLWLVLRAFGIGGTTLGLLVISFAMPVAANSSMLAAAHDGDYKTASSLVFLSTAGSLVTIPFLAGLLFGV